ncbi:MAG TPA: antibiotic biosynthesis monooxygenase [Anaerolineaceae bacterium]
MIMHVTIHHPDPEKTGGMVDALHRFEGQIRSQPGVLSVHTLKDSHTGALVSLAVWQSKDSWLSAQAAMIRAETDVDLSTWESQPPMVYHLEEI